MRRVLVFAALLGLTACGGPVTPEEEPSPGESQNMTSGEVEAMGPVICSDNDPNCYCSQFRTQTKCIQARTPSGVRCVWNYESRCVSEYW